MKTKFQKRCLRIGLLFMLTAIVLQVINCAHMDAWTEQEKIAAGAMVAGRAADMLSTSYALDHGCIETNPFLGEHPDDQTLLLWGIGTSLLILGIAHLLPSDWRIGVLYGTATISGIAAGKNYLEAQ